MGECKFKATCGGGHTTAEHHMDVNERRIKESCGIAVYNDIKDELNELARRRSADVVIITKI